MSKSRSHFKSSKLTNINTRGGPTKEGLVPVATNYIFSGSGLLRFHRPTSKPLFTKKKEYCLNGKSVRNAPTNTQCATTEEIANSGAVAALLARAQAVLQYLPPGVQSEDATLGQVETAEAAATLLVRAQAVLSQLAFLYGRSPTNATETEVQAAELLQRAQAVSTELQTLYGISGDPALAQATIQQIEAAEAAEAA